MNRESPFGVTRDGLPVTRYELATRANIRVALLDFGAVIHEWVVPDASGHIADIVLGYGEVSGYENTTTYFGAVIGRFGNRLAQGRFELNGRTYQLATNNGENHLHGGEVGFDKRLWQAQWYSESCIEFSLDSADGDQGYPGWLQVTVRYELSDEGELTITYGATSDADTIVNLTQHSYFNLSGQLSQPITDHLVQIDADYITEVDAGLIPTGQLMSVIGTPFDLREPVLISDCIDEPHTQLTYGGGFDHNYVLNHANQGLRRVAEVFHPASGRKLIVATDQPGMQLYSGNFLDGTERGKGGLAYPKRSGLCLETQGFPDAPNHPDFPSVVLRAGQRYQTQTRFSFVAQMRRSDF
ncbi:MAG: aldose epimerase family protein [Reinekea sp.]|jgi:aldose 1-epimerase|nr:aldose epimerase family protein [Reinekea sp.]